MWLLFGRIYTARLWRLWLSEKSQSCHRFHNYWFYVAELGIAPCETLTGTMHYYYGLLLIFAATTFSVDILQEAAGNAYCKYESNGVVCDDLGIRICNNSRCVSICRSLGLDNCRCPNDPNPQGLCSYCCGGYNQACVPVGDFGRAFGNDIPPILKQTRREFCVDVCPSEALNGKICPILNLNKSGICFKGECTDPCKLIDSATYQCSDGPCTNRTDKWCCYNSNSGCSLMTHMNLNVVNHFIDDLLQNGLWWRNGAANAAKATFGFGFIAGISFFPQLLNIWRL